MNYLSTSVFAACLALGSTLASAQDASTKAETKKSMSTQDCKDHMNTMKGQKRTDPATDETADKCADMKNTHSMKMKKHGAPKDDADTAPQGQMAPASK